MLSRPLHQITSLSAGRRRLAGLGASLLLAGILLPLSTPASAGEGMASYYGGRFHGRRTASGQRFNQNALTAAHRTLGFGTKVRVTNKRNGNSVVVTINDRGPYARGRVIDLSRAAAKRLGMLRSGVAPVRVEPLGRDESAGAGTRKKPRRAGAGLLRKLF